MAHLKIKIYPDPILKVKAEPLTDFGEASQKLFEDMNDYILKPFKREELLSTLSKFYKG